MPASSTELGGVWSKREGEILDATGTEILDKDTQNKDATLASFHHPLTADQQNTVMRAANAGGDFTLMTVPPYLALDPRELVVPPGAI